MKIEHYVLPVVIVIFLVQVTVNVFKPLMDRNSVSSSTFAQRKERIYYSSEIAPEAQWHSQLHLSLASRGEYDRHPADGGTLW